MIEKIKKLVELSKEFAEIGENLCFENDKHTHINDMLNVDLKFNNMTFYVSVYFASNYKTKLVKIADFQYMDYSNEIKYPLFYLNDGVLENLIECSSMFLFEVKRQNEENIEKIKRIKNENRAAEIEELKKRIILLENQKKK